jgi:hypothetical protein
VFQVSGLGSEAQRRRNLVVNEEDALASAALVCSQVIGGRIRTARALVEFPKSQVCLLYKATIWSFDF